MSHSTDNIQFCVDSEYQSDDDIEVCYSGIVVCWQILVTDVDHYRTKLLHNFVRRWIFMCESSYCFQRILAIAILSVCPFIRPSHGWISQKRCKLELPSLHRRQNKTHKAKSINKQHKIISIEYSMWVILKSPLTQFLGKFFGEFSRKIFFRYLSDFYWNPRHYSDSCKIHGHFPV